MRYCAQQQQTESLISSDFKPFASPSSSLQEKKKLGVNCQEVFNLTLICLVICLQLSVLGVALSHRSCSHPCLLSLFETRNAKRKQNYICCAVDSNVLVRFKTDLNQPLQHNCNRRWQKYRTEKLPSGF